MFGELSLSERRAELAVFLNTRKIAETVYEGTPLLGPIARQTLGGTLEGEATAQFEMQELLLIERPLATEERRAIARYLDVGARR